MLNFYKWGISVNIIEPINKEKTRIRYPFFRCSLGVVLCNHTYDIEWLAKHFVHCTSCKSSHRVGVPQPRGIVPWPRHQLPLFNRNHRIRDIMMPWFKHLREQAGPCALYASRGFITMRTQFF